MYRLTARILAVVIAALAIAGFFIEDDHLLGIMNVDLPLDILRTVLVLALLIVGFLRVPTAAVRGVLLVIGALYVGMGIAGIADPTLFGMLPTGLTEFDIVFHIVVGIAAFVIGALPDRSRRIDPNRPGVRADRAAGSNRDRA